MLENECRVGGLQLINLRRKIKAIRVKMMVRYLGNKEGQLWKIFLKEKINKCGGCGDSAIFMVLRRDVERFECLSKGSNECMG